MVDGEVHLWRASLGVASAAVESLRSNLSDAELQRASRLRSARARRDFVVARATMRSILGRYLGRDPAALRIAAGPSGKPVLLDDGVSVQFNLSHSGEMALVAVARRRDVGVDVEYLARELPAQRLADRFFAPEEAERLRGLRAEDRRRAFLRYWTRKEAVIKALGRGLSESLLRVPANRAGDERADVELELDVGGRTWLARDVDPADGYLGAVVAEGIEWKLRCWDFR